MSTAPEALPYYWAGWQGFSPFSSFARQPYLSNIWPVSRAALPIPQPDKAASASKAIATLT